MMAGTPTTPAPAFAHESERELARILDFYDVRWVYEPDTFPIRWTLDGTVAESFSPDFWLPDLDLYLELTTLKQSLVRKKNRKLRRLRELYPEVRIKLFYARDFRMLLLKFGRHALVDALTGTTGQVTNAADAVGSGRAATTTGDGSADVAGPGPAGDPATRAPDDGQPSRRRRSRRRRRSASPAAAVAVLAP